MKRLVWYNWTDGSSAARRKELGTYRLISRLNTMNKENKFDRYRLGRRPVKQGARPLLSDQDRVEKWTTESYDIDNSKQNAYTQYDRLQLRKRLNIGSWNVRSMQQLGKLQMLGRELKRMKVDVCGLTEVRWEGQGHFATIDGHMIAYSGGLKQGQHGVAVWIRKELTGAVMGYEPISDRLIRVRLSAKPRNITLIQGYGPTTAATDEEKDTFYEDLARTIRITKKSDILIITGDFNAKIGSEASEATGKYGLGEGNEAGERLMEFFIEHRLLVANTLFKHHPRRLYTWIAPDGKTKNQIDYIAISQQWKTSIKNCKTFPGADCDSDHQLLLATFKIKLSDKKREPMMTRLNLEELKGDLALQYTAEVANKFEALNDLEEEKTPDELWEKTKEILLVSAENTVGKARRKKHKSWVSDQTITKVDEKREAKQKDKNQYKKLKAEVQKLMRVDNKNHIEKVCTELEEAKKRGDMRSFFKTARTITTKFKPKSQCIRSTQGETLIEADKIAERWREYCQNLYKSEDRKYRQELDTLREPPPLKSEVARSIQQITSHKSVGHDGIPIELLKQGGESVVDRMHKICTAVWNKCDWPEDWVSSTFIPIPKKGDLKLCDNHRTIALISHASKILLKIILERMRNKTEFEIAEEQAGFRRGRGTRDQITNLRLIMHKAHEHQQPLYLCFIDYKKAFDSVSQEKLWQVMLDMGFPQHIVELIYKLYHNQRANVRVAGVISDWFKIGKGVRQGCILSPYLFNLLLEMVMREALDGYEGGIRIGGRRITNLRYADDIVLITSSQKELQELLDRINQISKEYGLEINVDKTKVMLTNQIENSCCFTVNGKQLEKVTSFIYLGSLICADATCSKEIRAKLAKGRGVNTGIQKIWKSHNLTTNTKIRLWKALVWPVATYGCESWTIKKEDEQRIEAFEMKGYRQIMRIKWIARRTNEWVLEQVGETRNFLNSIKGRKVSYFGHQMRKKGPSLEKELIQGTLPGRRSPGRPRMTWSDNIISWTGMSFETNIRLAAEREEWKDVIHSVVHPRFEED